MSGPTGNGRAVAPGTIGAPPSWPRPIASLLYGDADAQPLSGDDIDPSVCQDLNFGQVVDGVTNGREEADLIAAVLNRQLHDQGLIGFRQEIFRDLEDENLCANVTDFVALLGQVRSHFKQMGDMHSSHQRQGWFLDAALIYCEAIRSLVTAFESAQVASAGLAAFCDLFRSYADSDAFCALSSEALASRASLSAIRYCVHIGGGRVDVSRYDGQPDYSAEVLETFSRFQQASANDYRVKYRGWPAMNHVGAKILSLVARLHEDEFSELQTFCERHSHFYDPKVRQFEREVQFYLSFLEFLSPMKKAGLHFCFPEVSSERMVFATDTFDLALASRLTTGERPVVLNEFHLSEGERVFVVSGANQGGKTTFARTFGQLHHLASVGCPVPGTSARLNLFDRIFTHFEREEELQRMRGKLEDDLVRVKEVFDAATQDSIVILNEIFTSTTLNDARFLGQKVMERITQVGLLCVYVTFVDELASFSDSVVSMVSTIVPENPAERTYKVVRGPANGLAFAWAIAQKYDLTYERLREKVGR
jgi:DNA mismatch repair protein MutS